MRRSTEEGFMLCVSVLALVALVWLYVATM